MVSATELRSLSSRLEDALIGMIGDFFGGKTPWFIEHFVPIVLIAVIAGFFLDVVVNLVRFGPGPMLTLILKPLARRTEREDEPLTRAVAKAPVAVTNERGIPTFERNERRRSTPHDLGISLLAREKLDEAARKREERLNATPPAPPPRIYSAKLEDTGPTPVVTPEIITAGQSPIDFGDTGPTPAIDLDPAVFPVVSIRTEPEADDENPATEERDGTPDEP